MLNLFHHDQMTGFFQALDDQRIGFKNIDLWEFVATFMLGTGITGPWGHARIDFHLNI